MKKKRKKILKLNDTITEKISWNNIKTYKKEIEDLQEQIRIAERENKPDTVLALQTELFEAEFNKLETIKRFLDLYFKTLDNRFNQTLKEVLETRLRKQFKEGLIIDDYTELYSDLLLKVLKPQYEEKFKKAKNTQYIASKKQSLNTFHSKINNYDLVDSYSIRINDEHLINNLEALDIIDNSFLPILRKIFETKHLFKSEIFIELRQLLYNILMMGALETFNVKRAEFLLSDEDLVILRDKDFDIYQLFEKLKTYGIDLQSSSKLSKDRSKKFVNYNGFFLGLNVKPTYSIFLVRIGHDSVNKIVDGIRTIFKTKKGVSVDTLVKLLNNYIYTCSKEWDHLIDYDTSQKVDSYIMFKVKRFLKKLHPKKTKKFRTVTYAEYFSRDKKNESKKKLKKFKEVNSVKPLLNSFNRNYA